MMRWLLLFVLVVGFTVGLGAFAPLGMVMKFSGAQARGISWISAEGSLAGGRITGLRSGADLIGDARMTLRPAALLAARLEYDFEWTGPAGTGSGRASASASGITEVRDFIFDLNFAELGGLPVWMRRSGGRAQVRGDIIRLRRGACDSARGTTWSDALVRNETLLGPGWSEFQGALSCDDDALIVPFSSVNGNGTRLDATARVDAGRTSTLEARVSGFVSEQARYALPMAGFSPEGDAFVYRQPGTYTQSDLPQ